MWKLLARPEIVILLLDYIVIPVLARIAKDIKWTDIDDQLVAALKDLLKVMKKSRDDEKTKNKE